LPRIAGWVAGTLTFLGLLALVWPRCFPPVPSPLTLAVTFPAGIGGRGEPLITTGFAGDGDFLAVRYLDENTAVIVYDVWGVGGPTSEPFALQPRAQRTLEIEMPTLAHVTQFKSREKRALRVTLDGRDLLRADVHFHRRRPQEIFFGVNPLGGTIASERFRGQLELSTGRMLRGGPETIFAWPKRLGWMFSHELGRLALSLVASAIVGLVVARLTRWRLNALPRAARARARAPLPPPVFPTHSISPHRWFLATTALCTFVFVAVITGGTFRLIFPESFGNFYDYQALSLLQGRLDVPREALSDEAFVFEGKNYGYFGPTPALLRLPLVAAKIGFGKLSRSFMVLSYVACLAAAYALLIHVARLATGRQSWPSRFEVVLFTAMLGLGTTLFFLASRAYIYHEAILCGVAFALWGSYFSLRYLAEPHRRWWLGAVACGVLSVHARPPVGLFALSIIGCAALAVADRALASSSAAGAGTKLRATLKPFMVAVLAGIGVLSFNGLSYLKFRSFEGAPLRYHVQYNPGRLARIESRNFHASNFRFNFDGYVWRPDFVFRPTFPYFFLLGGNSDRYPGTKMDLVEPVTALPHTMPALVFLAVAGGAFAFWRWPDARRPLLVIAAAALPMSAALFTAVAMSQRYTADFCPVLLLLAAFGLQAFNLLRAKWLRAVHATVTALTALSILITLAITLHYEGEAVWGVPADVQQRYQTLKKTVDGLFGSTGHAR
jgi:hypothetical protein